MSLIYSALKPILRKSIAKKASMTREDFIRQAEKVQKRAYRFPDITGYDKQERNINGCKCIIYSKLDSDHSKAIVYYADAGCYRSFLGF